MPPLPEAIILVLAPWAPLFSHRGWLPAPRLLGGALLAPERRFTTDPRVLNRAPWSAPQGSRLLLGLLGPLLGPPEATLGLGAADTGQRRSGRRSRAQGCERDAVRATQKHVLRGVGLQGGTRRRVVPGPWRRRVGALPGLRALGGPAAQSARRRPQTSLEGVRQMRRHGRRWRPERRRVLVVERGFAAVSLALAWVKHHVVSVSPLRGEAALEHGPAPLTQGQRGRTPAQGKRQRRLQAWVERSDPPWESGEVAWYGGQRKRVGGFCRPALGYTPGWPPVALRLVLVGEPAGQRRRDAFCWTALEATPVPIRHGVMRRCSVEGTVAEGRAPLGLETHCPWAERAIARTTPVRLGLCSLVPVLALRLRQSSRLPVPVTAW